MNGVPYKTGDCEAVAMYFRNAYITRYKEVPESMMDEYHMRNNIEGEDGHIKLHYGLEIAMKSQIEIPLLWNAHVYIIRNSSLCKKVINVKETMKKIDKITFEMSRKQTIGPIVITFVIMCLLLIAQLSIAYTWEENPMKGLPGEVSTNDLDAEAVIETNNTNIEWANTEIIFPNEETEYGSRQYLVPGPEPEWTEVSIGENNGRWVWHCSYDMRIWWLTSMLPGVTAIGHWTFVYMSWWDGSQANWTQVDSESAYHSIYSNDYRVPDNNESVDMLGQFHLWFSDHGYTVGDKFEAHIFQQVKYNDGGGEHTPYVNHVYVYYEMTD